MRTAETVSVIVGDVWLATAARMRPQTISPRFSDCDSSECMVARTSLEVRRLTATVEATRIVGRPIPETSRDPAMAAATLRAWAKTTTPQVAARAAAV